MAKVGAKKKYDSKFPDKGMKLAEEGLIDIQIAHELGISQTTYYEYLKEYPEFSESIKRGKAKIDRLVVDGLLKRAQGFTVEETVSEMKLNEDGTAGNVTGIKKTTKYIAPDTGAAAFWLKNRQPDAWRDVRQIEGDLGGVLIVETDKETKELLDGISELGTKSPKDTDDQGV